MTELQERMRSAEVAGGSDAAGRDVRDRVMRSVGRRRAGRTALVTGGSLAAVALFVAAGFSLRGDADPITPATTSPVAEAANVTRMAVGELTFPQPSPEIWDEIDDTWTLALWTSAPEYSGSAREFHLLITAPDGRTWDAATIGQGVAPRVLAWDPAARTALISSAAGSAPEDADLGVVPLDGGEQSWTMECIDAAPADGAERWAARSDGGYVVHDGCGSEYWLEAGGFRRHTLTTDEADLLANARYPGAHYLMIPALQPEKAECNWLIGARYGAVGSGCAEGTSYQLHLGTHQALLQPLPGVETPVRISRWCGIDSPYGDLSDGSRGVGLIDGDYALPLVLDGEPAVDCIDGGRTWYVAGGDLYIAGSDSKITRLVDLTLPQGEEWNGAGVVDVAPAPWTSPLGYTLGTA